MMAGVDMVHVPYRGAALNNLAQEFESLPAISPA